jgi:hypothetical protein
VRNPCARSVQSMGSTMDQWQLRKRFAGYSFSALLLAEIGGCGGHSVSEADASADAQPLAADVPALDAADRADAEVAAAVADLAVCAPAAEVCDGIDNDCDGATDEDFQAQSPKGPVPLGSPCGGGVVVCVSLDKAGCSVSVEDDNATSQCDSSAILAPAGAPTSPLQATGGFVDVSANQPFSQLQIDPGLPTSVPDGSSPLALDVDKDGDLDVVWLDGIHGARLWTQTAPWQFADTSLYTGPVALAAMAALPDGLIALGGQKLVLLERQADGQWKDVAAERGLVKPENTAQIQHLLPADVNGDGRMDLVAGLFSCSPLFPSLYVWLDRGDGHFIESAKALGFDLHASVWANLFSDLDGDGVAELLMLTESCEPNPGVALYHGQNGVYAPQVLPPVFTVSSVPTSAIGGGGSPMGGAVADVNGDGALDYFLSEIELRDYVAQGGDPQKLNPDDPLLKGALSNQLLLSQPTGPRKLAGLQAGLWAPLSTKGKPMTAWTPIWSDLDHDGHLDLLLSHAAEYFAWTNGQGGTMRPVLFRNDGTQHFTDVSAPFGLPAQHDGRAMIVADLDGDGDDDLLIGGHGVAPKVLRNDIVHGGSDVRVRLIGQTSNPWGLQARLKLLTNQRTLVMEHNVQAVPQAMAMPLSHFALRAGEVPQTLTVQWPSGWSSQQAIGKPGLLEVTEPPLVALSTGWNPNGTQPVVVTATQFQANGQLAASGNCSIELAPGSKGQWQGPIACAGAACKRTWLGTAGTHNGADAIVVGCGGQTWQVRPRIGY